MPTAVGINDFWVQATRDGDVYLECPIGGCWGHIEVETDVFLTLRELRIRAGDHLDVVHRNEVEEGNGA